MFTSTLQTNLQELFIKSNQAYTCRWSPSWQNLYLHISFSKEPLSFLYCPGFLENEGKYNRYSASKLILMQERGLVNLGRSSSSSSSNQSRCWRTLFQLEMSMTGLHISTAWVSYTSSPILAASGQQAIGMHRVLSSCLLLCVEHSAVCSKVTTILPSSTAAKNVVL